MPRSPWIGVSGLSQPDQTVLMTPQSRSNQDGQQRPGNTLEVGPSATVRLLVLGQCAAEIDGLRVDSSSTHLFALLLLLCFNADRRQTRAELQQRLFDSATARSNSSHNLRQLLYRIRRLNIALSENQAGVVIHQQHVLSFDNQLRDLLSGECEGVSPTSVAFLPSYSPRLPSPFVEWVDRQRDRVENRIRSGLLDALTALRARHLWASVERVSTTLHEMDPLNSEAVGAMAESLAMLGRRGEALHLLDHFREATDTVDRSFAPLRSLRARVLKCGDWRTARTLRGREDCLAKISEAWAHAPTNGAWRFSLVGVAGIGKTRVADGFATQVGLEGNNVVRFTCDASSSQQPLSAFAHILPNLRALRGSLGASPKYVAPLARLSNAPFADESGIPHHSSAASLRAEIQAAVVDLLEAVSDDCPLLLIIDDAHFLDDASRHLIKTLTSAPNSAHVLVLLCLRPPHTPSPLVQNERRARRYSLEPLPANTSRQIVLDIAGPDCNEAHIERCLQHAAGSPFYLTALAGHVDGASKPTFDVQSLASENYSCLSVEARAVLEPSLLLGRLATIERVREVAAIDDVVLLAGLRELEILNLIRLNDGVLEVPHPLMHDALSALLPASVVAVLRRRIAVSLEVECLTDNGVSPLAWAAAQNWVAAGAPHSAVQLVRRCARHALQLGEPNIATELLAQLIDVHLPASLHADVLDEAITYADASSSPSVLAAATRARHALAQQCGEGHEKLKWFEFRTIEADYFNGAPLSFVVPLFSGLLRDHTATPVTRARCAVRLMVIADQNLDSTLACDVKYYLPSIPCSDCETLASIRRAELVFHIFCGDLPEAQILVDALLTKFSVPSGDDDSVKSRSFAGYALLRLGELKRASHVFVASYHYMVANGAYSHALYSSALVASAAIRSGDLPLADFWMRRSEAAARGGAAHEQSPSAGHHSNAATLAMYNGRYDEAERLIFEPGRDSSVLSSDRYKAVCLAMLVRLKQMRCIDVDPGEVETLAQLYFKGCKLGGQDQIVEALWCVRILSGDAMAASELLAEYLTEHRRERSVPDWSLRHTTAADEAWLVANPDLTRPF
jgi:DNA-binding SARP family transcriptional activator